MWIHVYVSGCDVTEDKILILQNENIEYYHYLRPQYGNQILIRTTGIGNRMEEPDLIREKIYTIRGQRVMFDFDLAKLYGIETRVLKQAVRRNLKRFEGEDFMFELTKKELTRSQIVILNNGRGSNFKYMPFVFTELGVSMLSSVLNSETAIEINRRIMRAFVAIRQYITSQKSSTGQLERRMQLMEDTLNDILTDQNDINEDTRMRLELIEETLAELQVNRKTASRTVVKGFGKG